MLLSLVKVANPSSQDRTPRRAIVLAVSSAAAPYRASGLVLWHETDLRECPSNVRYRGRSRHPAARLRLPAGCKFSLAPPSQGGTLSYSMRRFLWGLNEA